LIVYVPSFDRAFVRQNAELADVELGQIFGGIRGGAFVGCHFYESSLAAIKQNGITLQAKSCACALQESVTARSSNDASANLQACGCRGVSALCALLTNRIRTFRARARILGCNKG
jgi:hypothetical protein